MPFSTLARPAARSPALPLRLGVAALATGAALALSLALFDLVRGNPFLLFFGAVAVSAWYGGLAGGLLCTALSVLASSYFLIPPYGQLSLGPLDALRILVFSGVAGLISWLSEARRRAAERAWAEAERFEVTLASIGDAVICTDASGRVTFLNPLAEALTGWAEAEALGRPSAEVFDIINEESGLPVESPVERVLREGRVVGLANHTLLRSRAGGARPIDDSGAPIRSARGELIGAVLVFRDQSERRRAERERAELYAAAVQARGEAEAAVRARDIFFSVAAHELKTPLTALLGRAQLLARRGGRDGLLDERDARAVGVIVAQAQRLNQLISSLLDSARIEQGRLTIERAPFDLAALVARAADELRPTLDERHILRYEGPAEALLCEGDALRLEQVVQNLLTNAVKYSPTGGLVLLRLARVGGSAQISVRDEGIGIPAEALPSLFERYFRADNADPRHVSGLGLGLYVVREVVAQHGGSVGVESAEGRGSTFTVTLPLAPGVGGGRRDGTDPAAPPVG